MSNLTNPFPQMGTYGPNRVDLVGYDEKLNSMLNTIIGNIGHQPLFFRIIGEFGQGKTTLLKMIEARLAQYPDIEIFWWDIAQESDLSRVIKTKYKKVGEKQKIVFLIDESQEFVERTKNRLDLSNEEIMFQKTIRDFSDNKIENVDSSKIAIILALHPESDVRMFGPGKGRLDLAERGRDVLELKDIDYFMAMGIANKYFEANNMKLKDYFDESVIYTTFAMQSHVDHELIGKDRKNGRTFVQILFKMFELISQRKYERIGKEELAEILTSRPALLTISMEVEGKTKEVPLVLPGIKKYYEIVEQFDQATKDRFDFFLFNPKWHFQNEIEQRIPFDITKAKFLNKRETITIPEKKYREFLNNLETHEQNIIESFPKERIFKNNESTYLIFCEGISEALKRKIKKLTPLVTVYRIAEEYLIQIYKWSPGIKSEYSELLAKYSTSDTQGKRELIFGKTEYTTKQCTKGQMKHYYQITTFEPLKNVEFHVAFFFYSVGYPTPLKPFVKDIICELGDIEVDYAVLLIDPYVNLHAEGIKRIETEELCEIRKLQNRLFLFNFKSTDDFGQFLFSPRNFLEKLFHESAIPLLNEAEEKGLTERFLGLQSKIHQSQDKLIEAICEDIKKSMKIESVYLWMNIKNSNESKVIKEGALIKEIQNVGKKTYEKYVKLDEDLQIVGATISPVEQIFYSLFPHRKTSLFEVEKNLRKYVVHYSRIDIIKLGIQLLKARGLISIDEDEIQKNEPSKLLNSMKNNLEKILKSQRFLTSKQKNNLDTIKRKMDLIEKEINQHNNNQISLLRKAIYCYMLTEDFAIIKEMIPDTRHYSSISKNVEYILKTIKDLVIFFYTKMEKMIHGTLREENSEEIILNDLLKILWPNETISITCKIKGPTELKKYFPKIFFELVINKINDEEQKMILSQNKEEFIEVLSICKTNQDILLPKEITKLIVNLTKSATEKIRNFEGHIRDSIEKMTKYIEMSTKTSRFKYIGSMIEKLRKERNDLLLEKLIDKQFSKGTSEKVIKHCMRLFQYNITLLEKYVDLLITSTSERDGFEEISRIANQIRTLFSSQSLRNISDEDLILSYINTVNELPDKEFQELELFLILNSEGRSIDKDRLRNIAEHYNITEDSVLQSLLKKGKIKEYKQIARWFENGEEIKRERISYEIHDPSLDVQLNIKGISDVQQDITNEAEFEKMDQSFLPYSDNMKGEILLAPLCHPEIIYQWEEIEYKGKKVYRIGKPNKEKAVQSNEEAKIWFQDSFGNKVSLVPDIPANIDIKPELIKEGLIVTSNKTKQYANLISLCRIEDFKELFKSFLFNDNKIVDEYEDIAKKYEVNEKLLSDFVEHIKNNQQQIQAHHTHMYEFINLIE